MAVHWVLSLPLSCSPSLSNPLLFNCPLLLLFLLPLLSSPGSARLPDPPSSPLSAPPSARWFPQILDHENIRDKKIWKQRYWLSKEYFREGGPSILMIGGEGEASPHWLIGDSTLVQYASQQGAALVLLEHRFYGQSRPTNNTSVENLELLSSRQALADLAHFIATIRDEEGLLGPWVAVGGSYPGSLAGWLRLKYPHLVSGAVATSGPVAAKPDFPEYLQVVQEALKSSTPGCSEALSRAASQLTALVLNKSAQAQVTDMFQLCTPWTGQNPGVLVEALLGYFETAVQYNKPTPWHNSSTDTLCAQLMDKASGNELDQLAAINNKALEKPGGCLQADYSTLVGQLQQTDYNDPPNRVPGDVGNRPWFYQTCIEFGWYQSSSQKGHPFGATFPLGLFTKMCSDVFGAKFTPGLLKRGITNTLREYGGRDLASSVTNVAFIHGSLDPWHALGITHSTNQLAPAILIPGTSHCANLYPETEDDSKALIEARTMVGQLIGQWIGQAYKLQ